MNRPHRKQVESDADADDRLGGAIGVGLNQRCSEWHREHREDISGECGQRTSGGIRFREEQLRQDGSVLERITLAKHVVIDAV